MVKCERGMIERDQEEAERPGYTPPLVCQSYGTGLDQEEESVVARTN